jgi:hypothetical protein
MHCECDNIVLPETAVATAVSHHLVGRHGGTNERVQVLVEAVHLKTPLEREANRLPLESTANADASPLELSVVHDFVEPSILQTPWPEKFANRAALKAC